MEKLASFEARGKEMDHLKTTNQRAQEFIEVILAIWVADGLIKQIGFLNGLNNLWGLILVSGIVYLLVDYIFEVIIRRK